jgi:hypothetical protein
MVMRGKGSRVREGSCECTSRLTNQTALSEAWSHVKRAGSERRRPLISEDAFTSGFYMSSLTRIFCDEGGVYHVGFDL